MGEISKINLQDKLDLIDQSWKPKIIGEVNDVHVKLVKLTGDFVWHHHDEEDEMFIVIDGEMVMKFRDHEEKMQAGDLVTVPRGVDHMPCAPKTASVMMIERKTIQNTGNVINDLTTEAEWI